MGLLLRKMFRNRLGEVVACGAGLCLGWLLSAQPSMADVLSASPPIQVESAPELGPPPQETSWDDGAFVQELADEFGMDVSIVGLVFRKSREFVQEGKAEWRLLRTPESLTYIMLSMIRTESQGDPNAIGDGGRARGLTQIWVSTANQYGAASPEDLLDPKINLQFAFKHFRYLLQKYNGNFPLALYAWNRGGGTVDRLLRYGRSPANDYGPKVYRAAAQDEDLAFMAGN